MTVLLINTDLFSEFAFRTFPKKVKKRKEGGKERKGQEEERRKRIKVGILRIVLSSKFKRLSSVKRMNNKYL